MPPTVDSSFLSEAVNRLLSFNLVPERFHISDIVYPLFFIHYGEHRFISDSRHIYAFICWQKNLSARTYPWPLNFLHGFLFILISPQVRLPSNWNLSVSPKIPCIRLWFWFRDIQLCVLLFLFCFLFCASFRKPLFSFIKIPKSWRAKASLWPFFLMTALEKELIVFRPK